MLKEAIETTYLHFNRANDNFNEIIKYNLDVTIFEDKEKIKTIKYFKEIEAILKNITKYIEKKNLKG